MGRSAMQGLAGESNFLGGGIDQFLAVAAERVFQHGIESVPEAVRHGITSGAETTSILRRLSEQGSLVTLAFNRGNDAELITSTLNVSDDDSTLIFDQANRFELNRESLRDGKVSCSSIQQNAKIYFFLNGVNPGFVDGRDVLLSPVPSSLIRLQRRKDYRLPTPQGIPILVNLPATRKEASPEGLAATMLDISGGGMCIRVAPEYRRLEMDQRLRGVSFMLPTVGTVTTDMRIRNLREEALPNGKVMQRAVCQFLNLPTSMMNMIQRYILKAQRDRIARGV